MVSDKLIGIIAEQFSVDEENISMDTSFKDDLNADSLDLVELIMSLEDEFDLELEDDLVENIETVRDARDYIKTLLGN